VLVMGEKARRYQIAQGTLGNQLQSTSRISLNNKKGMRKEMNKYFIKYL